jgi:hypothetical protein
VDRRGGACRDPPCAEVTMPIDSNAWRDVELARVEVPRWTNEVADARGWSAIARATALSDADAAYTAADASTYVGADLRTYWLTLAGSASRSTLIASQPGGVAYVNTVIGALETLDAEEAQRARQGFNDVLGGIKAAAAAIADALGDLGDAAKKPFDIRWIWAVAVIAVSVAVIQSGGIRRGG